MPLCETFLKDMSYALIYDLRLNGKPMEQLLFPSNKRKIERKTHRNTYPESNFHQQRDYGRWYQSDKESLS